MATDYRLILLDDTDWCASSCYTRAQMIDAVVESGSVLTLDSYGLLVFDIRGLAPSQVLHAAARKLDVPGICDTAYGMVEGDTQFTMLM